MTGPRRVDALLAWFDAHGRALPWRETRDPYRILISEVMSQQTQIDRVLERYPRFLARFPNVEDLAAASALDVLAEWSGLGYNRRALSLHRCAIELTHNGWPNTVEGLAALPGVGPYTAAAVASICFDRVAPAVDTNLRRVLGRWNGASLTDAEARGFAEPLIDESRPGDWNQAVMDLGAGICTPRNPDCAACPVERWCVDASVYLAPRRQGEFAGSSRQARGAVIRLLIEGPADLDRMGTASGLDRERLASACRALCDEGLVESRGEEFYIAG